MSLARACILSQKLSLRNNLVKFGPQLRYISTSDKKRDVSSVGVEQVGGAKQKIWTTYGFSTKSDEEDKLHAHLSFFFGITISIVGTMFVIAYAPSDKDWLVREAFLELRRREQGGLPLVDRNYIDPSQIYLPSDEELGDTEIII